MKMDKGVEGVGFWFLSLNFELYSDAINGDSEVSERVGSKINQI